MELYVYNEHFEFVGIIDSFKSLRWRRRFYVHGEVELHVKASEANYEYLKRGYTIAREDRREAAYIESRILKENTVAIKASMWSKWLGNACVMEDTLTYLDTIEAHTALHRLFNSIYLPYRYEHGNYFEDGRSNRQGEEVYVTMNIGYRNLDYYLEKISRFSGTGYRASFATDLPDDKFYFDTYNGRDLTASGDGRYGRVVLSEDAETIKNPTVFEDDSSYYNAALVCGEGEGRERKTLRVEPFPDIYPLRRKYVDARDLQSDGLTDRQYKELLRQRGLSVLDEYSSRNVIDDGTINLGTSYVEHWDLGDIVTVDCSSKGVVEDLRIDEVEEIYEGGSSKIIPVFGNPVPDKLNLGDD